MSTSNLENVVSAIAGADLTGSQFLVVYVDGADGEKVKVSGAAGNATVLGLLVNAPADDAEALVQVQGFATGKAGAAIEPFDHVTSDAAGKLKPAATQNDYIIGQYVPLPEAGVLPDAAANDEIRVLLFANKRTLVP